MRNFLLICIITILNSCSASTNETMEKDKIIEYVNANNLEAVKQAIDSGIDVNTTTNENINLLLLATIKKQTEMATYLVSKGADVNAQAKNLDSAFLYAGASGQTELVKLYLEHGARFDVFNRYFGTALIPASERGHVETVKLLSTTANFPINHINRLGWTALLEAIILGDGSTKYQEIVQILIDNGADVNISDLDGISPLEHAKRKKQYEIVKILTKKN